MGIDVSKARQITAEAQAAISKSEQESDVQKTALDIIQSRFEPAIKTCASMGMNAHSDGVQSGPNLPEAISAILRQRGFMVNVREIGSISETGFGHRTIYVNW